MTATILVLEDDLTLQELFCDVLEDEGHQVIAAANLASLLQQLPERPDLLISDIMVDLQPVGIDAISAVRSAYAERVPAILCTAAANHVERYREQIEHLEAVVLAKPFSIDSLIQTVNDALGPRTLYA
jgi:DNA-binding NtrC family response regulator